MFTGEIHVHTDNSRNDGIVSVEQIVEAIKALGGKAVVSTEHGNLCSVYEYMEACKKAELKYIPGIEFYVDIGDSARTHLIVLAKNFKGFQAISKCVTASAYNMHNDRPIVTMEMLNEWFKDGFGHDNVIATSACMQGPLARKFLINNELDKKINKIEAKRGKEINPESETYVNMCSELRELETTLEQVKTERAEVAVTSKKTWKAVLNKAQRSGNEVAIAEAEALRASIENAKAILPDYKKREEIAGKAVKTKKEAMSPFDKSVEKYVKYSKEIAAIEAEKVSETAAKQEAEKTLRTMLDIFGEDNFYCELQYHGIDEEKICMPQIAELAQEFNIPVVAANDVHMLHREDAEARQILWSQYQENPWNDIEPQDYELYLKTDEERIEWLGKILPDAIVTQAIANIAEILEKCNVEFEIGSHYPKFPCPEGAKLHLRRLIQSGKKKIANWTKEYDARLKYELITIEQMGFSDYLCIVEDFLNYARLIGKIDLNDPKFLEKPFDFDNLKELAKGQVGEGCGPGRGSAAGCLICYLIGITNINPIEKGLLFERFLNPQRVTMPDIDSDIAPLVRPWVIAYIKNKYGAKSVCQILTKSYFGAKSSIQAAGRVLGKKEGDKSKYTGLSLEMSKSIEDTTSLDELEEGILSTFGSNPKAKEILRMAHLLEGTISGFGTHAAGIIISDNGDVSDYVPLMAVGDAIDCSCDLNFVEPLGMLKLDLLGLRNLGIITEAEKAVQSALGIELSMDKFPEEPEVFKEIFAKGLTNGVFQFESEGMKKTLINFGPENVSDLTLLNAVFRPGPLQYIDSITAVKKGEETPEYVIPEMASILDETYGKPTYQEQIMGIFNKFAGFSLGEADIIRRYMSKKKVEKFMAYKDAFIEGLCKKGAIKEKAEKFWEELCSFSLYAFNRSHAAAYAAVAYATAYLKYNYKEAYACGLLNYTASDKMPKMVLDVKNQGVCLKCPDINISGENFSLHGEDVFFGLRPIPMVAASAVAIINERTKNGEFTDFKDFIKRVNPKKNVLENLVKAGAFDRLYSGNRNDLFAAITAHLDVLKKINAKKKFIEEISPEDEAKISKHKTLLKKLQEEFEELEIPVTTESTLEKLNAEKNLLGYYISGHPMDGISSETSLTALEEGVEVRITALASDFEYKETKSEKKPMMFMNLSDGTDVVHAVLFPREFDKYADVIQEGKIYNIVGSAKGTDENKTFVIKNVSNFIPKQKPAVIKVPSWKIWLSKKEKNILPFAVPSGGVRLTVYCEDNGKTYPTKYWVSKDIETADIKW